MTGAAGEFGPRYEILGELERGGGGVVLESRDVDLKRLVAMRVLCESDLDDPTAVARFVEEARVLGRLQHPGIVPVYDLGRAANERPFFTMKRVSGEGLASILDARRKPDDDRPRLLQIFEQVGQTVAYAHARGVVHGDLRPGMIRVGAFGEVLVEGWGVTEGADEGSDVRALGAILGEILSGSNGLGLLDEGDGALTSLARRCHARSGESRPQAREVAAAVAEHRAEAEARTHRSRLRAVEERARAERARADAEDARAAAAEDRRARRQTLALAAAVLLVVVIAGTTWWAVEQSREERNRRADVTVEAALEEATRRKAGGERNAALAAAERASELAGVSHVRPGLREQAQALLLEVREGVDSFRALEARALADEAAIRRLEAIRIGGGAGELEPTAADAAYAGAFREIGVVPEEMELEEAASALRSRSGLVDLTTALDAWALLRRGIGGTAEGRRIVEIARAVDRDPTRGAIREAGSRRDTEALRTLARDLDVASHSPRTLGLLAMILREVGEPDAAADLLRKALFRHPDDLWIVYELAGSALEADPTDAAEAVRCLTAAVALRPGSPGLRFALGLARDGHGESGSADAALRRAGELERAESDR